jgi:hypothetical protein
VRNSDTTTTTTTTTNNNNNNNTNDHSAYVLRHVDIEMKLHVFQILPKIGERFKFLVCFTSTHRTWGSVSVLQRRHESNVEGKICIRAINRTLLIQPVASGCIVAAVPANNNTFSLSGSVNNSKGVRNEGGLREDGNDAPCDIQTCNYRKF